MFNMLMDVLLLSAPPHVWPPQIGKKHLLMSPVFTDGRGQKLHGGCSDRELYNIWSPDFIGGSEWGWGLVQ